jgi:predicted DNA-binding transcriptional regulator YafY
MVTGPAGTASLPRVATAQTISVLQGAVDAAQTVWLGYVDGHGAVVERAVDPIRVDRGYLTAYDQRNQEVRTFAVHRITGVAALR